MKSILFLILCTSFIQDEVRCMRFETDVGIPDDYADFAPDGKVWNNGNAAVQGQFPWNVGIGLLNVNGSQTPFCSGTLISPDWVLTAARCVLGVGNLELKFGRIDRSAYEQIQYSQTYFIHPFYSESVLGDEKMSRNNIALIRLDSSAQVSENVRPLGVAHFPMITSIARFAGWGTTSATSGLSPRLNYANMWVSPNALCQSFYKSPITSTHICTAGSTPQKTGTCDGDAGGALTVYREDNWYVVGVAFLAKDTCKFATPPSSVYTRVSPYFDWIGNTTGLNLTLGGTTLPPFTTTVDPGSGSQRIQSLGYIFVITIYLSAWTIRQ